MKLPVTTACEVMVASSNLHTELTVMVPPVFFMSCFEQACSSEPPKFMFISLVGRGVGALLHHLRRQVATLEGHLEFPQAGLARRHVERESGRGGEKCKSDDGETTHVSPP